jgi:hypothetical protein
MNTATTLAAWIALFLAVPSSAVAAFQVRHYILFRRPVFTVQEAELRVERKAGMTFVGTEGSIVLNARGARYPVTLTRWGCMLYTSGRKGGSGAGLLTEGGFTLQPEVWTRLAVGNVGVGLPGEPPPSLYAEVYLSNPREVFRVDMKFKLAKDASKYYLDDLDEEGRYWYFTTMRGSRGTWGILRRFRGRLARLRARLPGGGQKG